ncbi:MAG: lactate racemase domain-containing protein [Planctomycetota bacterium]|jgi:nickel-dependent lactate racemase
MPAEQPPTPLTEEQVREKLVAGLRPEEMAGKKVLAVIPDSTRTAPVAQFYRLLCELIGGRAARLDFLIALGTHPPMEEEAITRLVGAGPEERAKHPVYNHLWKDPSELIDLGEIPAAEIAEISGGLMKLAVPVTVNRRVAEYDQLVLLGPVFPHEVVGFSGGNKYLFPGIAGQRIIDMFHWLGALITNVGIIGVAETPVRRVVERAASMVDTPKLGCCMVVHGGEMVGLEVGDVPEAWRAAAAISDRLHIVYKDRPFESVLSCAPEMYDDLWTGGKCMYKLEPVVADGGELIIYAPHITEISYTHGKVLDEVGYHCRDFFAAQWASYEKYPWGVLAHSTHVKGAGTYEGGVEKPRVNVVLATGIPEERCRRVNLGYRDPASIDPAEWIDREDRGRLYVKKAGETLYRLG